MREGPTDWVPKSAKHSVGPNEHFRRAWNGRSVLLEMRINERGAVTNAQAIDPPRSYASPTHTTDVVRTPMRTNLVAAAYTASRAPPHSRGTGASPALSPCGAWRRSVAASGFRMSWDGNEIAWSDARWRCRHRQIPSANTLLPRRGLRPLATAGEVVGLHERRWTALRRPDGRLSGRRQTQNVRRKRPNQADGRRWRFS